MNSVKGILEKFRDLILTKNELDTLLLIDHAEMRLDKPIEVCTNHLVELLSRYKNGYVSEQTILDWVNTIWFSGWFEYCDEQCDSIASVMNELEEIDEDGKCITPEKAELYIQALKNNIEI